MFRLPCLASLPFSSLFFSCSGFEASGGAGWPPAPTGGGGSGGIEEPHLLEAYLKPHLTLWSWTFLNLSFSFNIWQENWHFLLMYGLPFLTVWTWVVAEVFPCIEHFVLPVGTVCQKNYSIYFCAIAQWTSAGLILPDLPCIRKYFLDYLLCLVIIVHRAGLHSIQCIAFAAISFM